MALILSIESSSNTCGVALSNSEKVIASYSIFERNMHDKYLAEFSRRLLRDYGKNVADLDAVAVSAGPGSFTGLRIGGALAKALTYDNKPALIAVPTLEALANASIDLAKIAGKEKIVASMASHRDLYYIQYFDLTCEEASEIETVHFDDIKEIDLNAILLTGEALHNIEYFHTISDPKAEFISAVAYKYFKNNRFTPSEEFIPLYAQEFQPRGFKK